MADYNAEQENLFKEIDEDLRQERFAKLWKKYGPYIISAAVALVLVAGLVADLIATSGAHRVLCVTVDAPK